MPEEMNYVKRTQRDYSLSLKLQIVQEIERGEFSNTFIEDLSTLAQISSTNKYFSRTGSTTFPSLQRKLPYRA